MSPDDIVSRQDSDLLGIGLLALVLGVVGIVFPQSYGIGWWFLPRSIRPSASFFRICGILIALFGLALVIPSAFQMLTLSWRR